MAHAHRTIERHRHGVTDVQTTRAGGRDHLTVRVEQHHPPVDPMREFGNHGDHPTSPRHLRQHLGAGGDAAVLGGLVRGDQRNQARVHHVGGCAGHEQGGHRRRGQRRTQAVVDLAARHDQDACREGCATRLVRQRFGDLGWCPDDQGGMAADTAITNSASRTAPSTGAATSTVPGDTSAER